MKAEGQNLDTSAPITEARRMFTPEEANLTLPLVRRVVTDILVIGQELKAALKRLGDTTPETMEGLKALSERLIGETYWGFWSTVDNLPARQCQNLAWLAGLRAVGGEMDRARDHLRESLAFLGSEEIGPAAHTLKRQFVGQMDRMFPQLAGEPELQSLRQEISQD